MFRILYRFLAMSARLAVRSGRSKDLEIIVLRHQLAVLRRQAEKPQLSDDDRTLLGVIAAALPRRLRQGWTVTPETLLRWHRRQIARHWTQLSQRRGRPSTAGMIRNLILEMANNNPTWGYRRITGELNRLGHRVGASTVWRILNQHDIDPAPSRSEVTWTQFLRSQAAVACDFATIDTTFLLGQAATPEYGVPMGTKSTTGPAAEPSWKQSLATCSRPCPGQTSTDWEQP